METLFWYETNLTERENIAPQFDGISIEKWGLSARTHNALKHYNPNMTIGDVIRIDVRIMFIRGLGIKCLQELDAEVRNLLSNPVLRKVSHSASTSEMALEDKLNQLPESVLGLSLDRLHLEIRTHNSLIESNITTIGQLVRVLQQHKVENFVGLGKTGEGRIRKSLSTLLSSLTSDGAIDWIDYCEKQEIQLIPQDIKIDVSVGAVVKELPKLIKQILHQKFDERAWLIIQRRFELDNSKKMTLEELGETFGLTRERVRQIEEKTLNELKEVFIEDKYAGKNYHLHPAVRHAVQSLYDLVISEIQHMILETELLAHITSNLKIDLEQIRPSLLLLLTIANIECIKFDDPDLVPIWGYIEPSERGTLERGIQELDRFLTRETAQSQGELDALLRINTGLEKSKKLSLEQLRNLIHLCSTIERREDGLLQGKFEYLKTRGNQMERVLTETGQSMHLKNIARELNKRLVPLGKRKVNIRVQGESNTIGNQISVDDRFVPIGHSGEWGLKSWSHIDTRGIEEIIEHFLITKNEPATEEEIYVYVKERRPVGRQSVPIYLAVNALFKKISRTHWGLAVWPESQNAVTWNPEQVAEFVAQIFRDNKVTELEYKFVKQKLMEAANVTAKQAQGLLWRNPVIKTRKGVKWGDRWAIFQPDYQAKLKETGARSPTKRATLRQKIGETIKQLLEASPTKQMILSEMVAGILKAHKCPKHTAYAYIANLDFVERIDVLGSNTKIYRLKGTHSVLSFPQVQKISTESLKQKVERALPFLNENDIDLGLFLLSKEFEATLKTYLVKANSKGKLSTVPGPDSNKWMIANMVDSARANGIITSVGELQLLRQERNNRAHGTMPSIDERRALMNSAQYIAGMYIDYIKLFDDLTNNLK